MTYEEYKKAFEDILALSEKIENLAKKNKFDVGKIYWTWKNK